MATLSGFSASFPRPAPCAPSPNYPNPSSSELPVPSGLFYQFPHFTHTHTDLRAGNTVRRLRPRGRVWETCFKDKGLAETSQDHHRQVAPQQIIHWCQRQEFTKSILVGKGQAMGGGGASLCSALPASNTPPLTKHPQMVLTGSSVSEWCWGRSPGPRDGWSLQDGTELTQRCRNPGGSTGGKAGTCRHEGGEVQWALPLYLLPPSHPLNPHGREVCLSIALHRGWEAEAQLG